MLKYLLNFLFVFLMLSSFSFANNGDTKLQAKLQKEYGRDLTKAPFFLRFAYNKEFNKDWGKTDYPQRLSFLADYETKSAAEQAKEKADAEAAAIKEKQRLLEKKEELRKEKDKLKAEKAKEKAEQLADKERQKEFDTRVKEQQRELRQMTHRKATQGSDQAPSQGPDQGAY